MVSHNEIIEGFMTEIAKLEIQKNLNVIISDQSAPYPQL